MQVTYPFIHTYCWLKNISCTINRDKQCVKSIYLYVRILFARISLLRTNLRAFVRNRAFLYPLFRYRTRSSVHFRHVKLGVGLKERGQVCKLTQCRQAAIAVHYPHLCRQKSPGWFIHINVGVIARGTLSGKQNGREKSRLRFIISDTTRANVFPWLLTP